MWLFDTDSSDCDSAVTGSAAEADTAEVQTAIVELDSEQIALYRGNREYQTITVEHYSIGIHKPTFHVAICIDFNHCVLSVNVPAKMFECCAEQQLGHSLVIIKVSHCHVHVIQMECLHLSLFHKSSNIYMKSTVCHAITNTKTVAFTVG